MKNRSALVLLASLVLGSGLPTLAADSPASTVPLDREGILNAALANSPAIRSARTDYENARDKALYAASIWQSSLSVNGQYKGAFDSAPTTGGSSASASASGLSAGASVTLKPFDFLSVDASLDTSLAFKAGLNIKPFADSGQAQTATQNLEDQELRYTDATRGLKTSIYKAWSSWAKAWGQMELANLSLESANRTLADRQTRFEAEALSTSDLDSARSAALQSAKDQTDQTINELQARYDLLNQAGLSLDQALATPPPITGEELQARVDSIIANGRGLVPEINVELARRNLARATADAKKVPGILSSLGASASLSGSASALSSWQVGLSYSLSAANFTPRESDSRQRSIESASQTLETALYQETKTRAVATQKLKGSLSLAENANMQQAQAQKSLITEQARFDAGSSSVQKLADASLSARKAELNAAAAWRDLEIELLSRQE
jgi:outer membrane protein TolC